MSTAVEINAMMNRLTEWATAVGALTARMEAVCATLERVVQIQADHANWIATHEKIEDHLRQLENRVAIIERLHSDQASIAAFSGRVKSGWVRAAEILVPVLLAALGYMLGKGGQW